jgi:hypothetical protein
MSQQFKQRLQIVICPGIHPAALSQRLLHALSDALSGALVVPAQLPAYSGAHILGFLLEQFAGSERHLPERLKLALQTPILLVGFSAGVVGAITAAHLWQSLGGVVVALIAVDGWGVPLVASFPVHRLSHDAFTHWSSALLGAGQTSFYAEPSVAHLSLWQSPQLVWGWSVQRDQSRSRYCRTSAAEFLQHCLEQYQPLYRPGN